MNTKATLRRLLFATLYVCACPAAHADVVVVAGSSSTLATLTKEQVADIFLGKNTSARPLDLVDSNPLREEFYTKVTGKSAAQVKSYWSKLAFTGKGTPPKEAASSAEVKKMVGSTPGLVGYVEKAAADGSVKVLFTLP